MSLPRDKDIHGGEGSRNPSKESQDRERVVHVPWCVCICIDNGYQVAHYTLDVSLCVQ